MAPFKTLLSSTNQLKLYSDKPFLIFFARSNDIVIYKLLKTLDGVDVQIEMVQPIKETLLEAIPLAFDALKLEKGRRVKMIMILDDYYLTMHRIQLSVDQLKSLAHSLELEIDHLSDFFYGVTVAPVEVKNMVTVLVYLIKKANLQLIEKVFLSNGFLLRRIVTRYHAFSTLFKCGVFDIDPKKPVVFIDIGLTRTRLFIVLNNEIKMYRRMPMRLDEKIKPNKQFQVVISSIDSFASSSIESFALKHNIPTIDSIYILSDFLDIPAKLTGVKLNRTVIAKAPIKPSILPGKGIKNEALYLYVHGLYLMMFSNDKFNLIPFMKRFEKFGLRVILGCFTLALMIIIGYQSLEYFKLKKAYDSYRVNQSKQLLMQAQKKREMVQLRERINKQKKIIDYADLTSISYKSDVSIDDFLYQLTAMSSADISFSVLRIRNKKITITGTSSAFSGNYSFYTFLQKLENLPYLGRIHYSLGLGGAPNASSFTIEVFWNDG